jgi:hypothetical protein
MTVRMVFVRRFSRRAQADESDDVRGGVCERVEAVGNNADSAGGVAEQQLRPGDREVEE